MIHSYGCTHGAWQLCLGCGSTICGCMGTGRGQCPKCYRGLLTNYYKIGHQCGYKGCGKAAVAAVPRVGFACYSCAVERGSYKPPENDIDFCSPGMPTYHTQSVLRALGFTGRANEFYGVTR